MNRKDRIFLEIIVGLVLIMVVLYFFVDVEPKDIWPAERVEVESGTRLIMGTLANIIAVSPDSATAKDAIEAALEQLGEVEKLMSIHLPNSEITRLNKEAADRAVGVSEPTFEVLQKAAEFSRLTNGAFDVTVGPLIELWASAELAGVVPSKQDIQKTLSLVGCEKLLLDANDRTVRFAQAGMKLDLGGIAKGFAIDKAVEAMKAAGAIGGMVNVGGDVRCFGAARKGATKWSIGLQDSQKADDGNVRESKLLMILNAPDMAVATSGDYRRYVVIQGEIYSHIIDVNSGFASSRLSSVTIICRDAISADALATAVSVMGGKSGLELIEKLPRTEAIVITARPDYELLKSSGAEKYIERDLRLADATSSTK